MATITVEIGKKGKKKTRAISFLICHGKTKKRIPTEVSVTDAELSTNGKKIKNVYKAKIIEDMKKELENKLYSLSMEFIGVDVDANYIVEKLTEKSVNDIDFFTFADDWISHSNKKGIKNYLTMLNSLEKYNGSRNLPFKNINYKYLTGYEDYLNGKERAQSLYIGMMRHLYREAMLAYNTDSHQVITNDPFLRYKVPRQQLKKGVRALSIDDLIKIYNYSNKDYKRAQQARDCFIMSFCLMGINSIDMYYCAQTKDDVIRYNRAKTKDRRSDNAYIEVKIHPIIVDIINRYRDAKSKYLFNFCKRYSTPSTFNQNINKGLKIVSKDTGIPNLEFYQARHTFATLSRNLMRFSKSDVDEALNHVGTMDIADVYIKKDFTIINDNNFKLIDNVFSTLFRNSLYINKI